MTIYRERLWAAPWLFVSTALVIPASLLVFLPINQLVGVAVSIVLYAGCVILLLLGSPTIAVTDTEFIAGKARLPIALIGTVAGFSGTDARDQRGPKLDARAWLLIRGWIDPVVTLEVVDDGDPTPYWVVSTRRPADVIDAVAQAKAAAKART